MDTLEGEVTTLRQSLLMGFNNKEETVLDCQITEITGMTYLQAHCCAHDTCRSGWNAIINTCRAKKGQSAMTKNRTKTGVAEYQKVFHLNNISP